MTATGARPLARPVVREVAEDVFAYTHDRGGWCVSNAGVVAGRDGALVIDTLATEGRTRALAEFVDRHAAGRAAPSSTPITTGTTISAITSSAARRSSLPTIGSARR
nr:hypothetical protein [Nocardia tengchongensis]